MSFCYHNMAIMETQLRANKCVTQLNVSCTCVFVSVLSHSINSFDSHLSSHMAAATATMATATATAATMTKNNNNINND